MTAVLPFIDIHTHRRTTETSGIAVLNFSQKDGLFSQEEDISSLFTEGVSRASAGLHPWFLTKENFEQDLGKLSQFVHNQQVIAIGECGLDKLRGEDMAFQTAAFEAQIRLAESVSKPVIVHCVRAFGEVVAIKKRLKPRVPLIIHGFNKNATVLAELLRQGFFISIGSAILVKKRSDTDLSRDYREGVSLSELLPQIPLNRLFFETDDVENINISTIYEAASDALNIDLNDLKSIVYENFNTLFVPRIPFVNRDFHFL